MPTVTHPATGRTRTVAAPKLPGLFKAGWELVEDTVPADPPAGEGLPHEPDPELASQIADTLSGLGDDDNDDPQD